MGQPRQARHAAATRGRPALRPLRRTPAALVVGLCLVLTGGAAAAVAAVGDRSAGPAAAPRAEPLPTITVTPTAPAPAAKPRPKAAPAKKKKLTLAQLRAEVARVDAELDRRTRLVEESTVALTDARRRLATTRAAAKQARIDADRAHVELGKYASAAYRGQQLSPVVTVLMGPPAGAEQTLRNLQNLEQTGQIKTDIAGYAADTAARAATLEREAAAIATEARAATIRLTAARESARRLALTTQRTLDAELRRIAAVRARLAAKACTDKAKVAAEYPNGMIPEELLCSLGVGAYVMRGDAAVAFKKLAAAYRKEFAAPICVNSAYRTRAHQASLYAADPIMVARPGRSHHGLGLAVDLCGGIQQFGSEQHVWMQDNAARFGFHHPEWAQQDGSLPEPWHWEYDVPVLAPGVAATPAADTAAKGTKPRS